MSTIPPHDGSVPHPEPHRRAVDESGRLIPLAPEEARRRAEEGVQAIRALDTISDATDVDAVWDAFDRTGDGDGRPDSDGAR